MTDTETRTDAPESGPTRPVPTSAPALGVGGALRFVWTQLTSMRTALVLLFALALAAVPGSLVPQRKVSPVRVSDFIAEHPTLGPIYQRSGCSTSSPRPGSPRSTCCCSCPWSAASSPGSACTAGRCVTRRRGRRGTCPGCRRTRSIKSETGIDERRPAGAGRRGAEAAAVPGRLDSDDTGIQSVAAERGYLREAGNLVFHLSLLLLLVGVALGGLFGFRGTSVVIVGQGFANTLTQYDDLTTGGRFSDRQLQPFTVAVRDFQVRFETGDVQRGAARLFELDAEVTARTRSGAVPADHRGQPPAEHGRHHRAPDRPRLRPDGHGQGRRRQRRLLRAGGVLAAGRQLHLGRGDQGPGRPARAAGVRGHLRPDGDRRSSRARGRCSPTRSTRRCTSTPGPARRRTRPGCRRTSTPWTPPG